MFTLFGRPGWGSVLVEAQLTLYGLPYAMEEVGDLLRSAEARARLAALNPLAQTPTLVLPGGKVMTESAAITLHLADIARQHTLVPAPDEPARPAFLRWLVFLVANIYPTFTYADVPDRFCPAACADGFVANVNEYCKTLWRQMEGEAAAPWFLGDRFSALDIYIAAITRWRPGRPWFAAHAPRLAAIAQRADALPELAEIWRRNFPPTA
jgi:GST-like protein